MPELNKQSQIGSVAQAGIQTQIPANISQLNLTLPAAYLAQFKVEMSESLVAKVVLEKVLTQPMFKRFNLGNVREKPNGDYIVILQGSCFVRDWTTVDMTITDLVSPLPSA